MNVERLRKKRENSERKRVRRTRKRTSIWRQYSERKREREGGHRVKVKILRNKERTYDEGIQMYRQNLRKKRI